MTTSTSTATLGLCLTLLGACFSSTTSEPPPVAESPALVGTLIVDWTINGVHDPAQCQQSSAAAIDVIVSGPDGGRFRQDCTAFATSISLPRGNYTASAVLLDSSGDDRTTAVQLDAFVIRGNDQLTIPIDFPADSFR